MRVIGSIQLDFESETMTDEKLEAFKVKLQSFVDDNFDIMLYDISDGIGATIDSLNPAYLDSVENYK